jgi:chorismate-pyruvate lyase
VTAIIKAVKGDVSIRTIEQRVIGADSRIAELLWINEGDEVNYRVVDIIASGDVVGRAVSYTPLQRLNGEFIRDIMKADTPIGEIIRKHRLEVRREIRWWRIEKARELADIFGIEADEDVLVRNYHIFHRKNVLMNITEHFPLSKFDFPH